MSNRWIPEQEYDEIYCGKHLKNSVHFVSSFHVYMRVCVSLPLTSVLYTPSFFRGEGGAQKKGPRGSPDLCQLQDLLKREKFILL